MSENRDRDEDGRAKQARPRDELGRPLPYGAVGVEPVSEEPLPPEETVRFASSLVEQGRPFAAHEIFEVRWKSGPECERDLWQGLAQLCVGLTHALRGNHVGLWSTAQFSATMTATTETINGVPATVVRVTLGGLTSGSVRTVTSTAAMTWTPSANATDLVGQRCSSAPVTESGPLDRDF